MKAMRILVIDDNADNIKSAESRLGKQHHLTTCDTIQAAYTVLSSEAEFDAVLTDLFMPLGTFRGSMNTRDYDRPRGDLPAGLVFAIKAANKGIRTVICTDANHHTDWICAILDLVSCFSKPDKERRISYVEARTAAISGPYADESKPIVKDWKKAMQASGLFPESEKKGDKK